MIHKPIMRWGLLIGQHLSVLHLALVGERLDKAAHKAGKVLLQPGGVLGLNDVIAYESGVVANERARPKRHAHGNFFVWELRRPQMSV
jgi:hypothetical protein